MDAQIAIEMVFLTKRINVHMTMEKEKMVVSKVLNLELIQMEEDINPVL